MRIFSEQNEQGCRMQHQLDLYIENAINIALTAGSMIAHDKIEVNDSEELICTIEALAEEFESIKSIRSYTWHDYILDIDEFAERNLLGRYAK